MRFFAPAKLNLSLDVGLLRGDGYHAVRTVMQAVSLGDRLFVTPSESFRVENPWVPAGDLVHRAGTLFARAAGVKIPAAIRVEKRIPIGAGLGGGSTDAACALRALHGLFRSDMPPDELRAIAADLGSDVPFFLGDSPIALGEGRGEEIIPLPPRPPRWAVIAWPERGLSTADVYRKAGPGSAGATDAVLAGADAAGNDLEEPARQLSPALDEMLRRAAAQRVRLRVTGSGSAAFALFGDDAAARDALTAARAIAYRAVLCRTLSAWPWQVNLPAANE